MRIGQAFPSKYLKASDIPDGKFVPVTMDHVVVENVAGNDDPEAEKPVLYFAGKSKGMVLNKTNSTVISGAYGDETEDWTGKRILLYSTETTFQGKTMPCLRVKITKAETVAQSPAPPPPKIARPAPSSAPVAAPFGDEQVFDEESIPFAWEGRNVLLLGGAAPI